MASDRVALSGIVGGVAADADGESDVASAVHGDVTSFIDLYEANLSVVFRFLYAQVGNRQDAEDLAASVFERAWRSVATYQGSGSFRGWLLTIARRTLADHYRSRPVPAAQMDSVADDLLDPALGPEDQALRSDARRQLLLMINSLGTEQREVIVLRFISELRYKEIAQITEKSEPAVKMIAYRALEELRKRYPDEQR